ncbi:hypothetical protein SK128_009200 [Halocaridina rubra]|uniref:Uncharacterized protein n=1 Tax=Halocaridina rubra TaxID=373956 RepID=A0AAN8WFN7_HALRR
MEKLRSSATVLTAFVLISYCKAAEEDEDEQINAISEENAEPKVIIAEKPDNIYELIATYASSIQVSLFVLFVLYNLLKPILRRRKRSESLWTEDRDTNYMNTVEYILKSIDPVDSAFNLMNVNEENCKKQKICQIQKTLTGAPFFGSIMRNLK